MGKLDGSASTEIEAPIEAVYAVAADIERSLRWQSRFTVAECIEREGDAQTLVYIEIDAKMRTLGAEMRFSYKEPTLISWKQEKGDLKSVEGSWELEDLGKGLTRATYQLKVDPGRMLGMLIPGPVMSAARGQLIGTMPEKLKDFVETESGAGSG